MKEENRVLKVGDLVTPKTEEEHKYIIGGVSKYIGVTGRIVEINHKRKLPVAVVFPDNARVEVDFKTEELKKADTGYFFNSSPHFDNVFNVISEDIKSIEQERKDSGSPLPILESDIGEITRSVLSVIFDANAYWKNKFKSEERRLKTWNKQIKKESE